MDWTKKTNRLKTLGTALFLLWTIGIFFFYFFGYRGGTFHLNEAHKYYFEAFRLMAHYVNFLEVTTLEVSPFLNIIIIYGSLISVLLILVPKFLAADIPLWKVSPIQLILLFYLNSFVVFCLWSLIFNVNTSFLWPYFKTSLPVFLLLCGLILLTLSAGKYLLDMVKAKTLTSPLEELIYSFALGIIIFSFLIFVLGLLGLITPIATMILLLGITMLCIRQIIFWLKKTFTRAFSLEVKISNGLIWGLIIISLIFANHFVKLLTSFPVGFDETSRYMNDVRQLAISGDLIRGVLPYPTALYLSIPYSILKNIMGPRALNLSFGLFEVLALVSLLTQYIKAKEEQIQKHRTNILLIVLLFLSLPMIAFQLSSDSKTDISSLFMATLAFMSWLKWRRNQKFFDLKLFSFLAGFALLIKPTSIFLFLPMLCIEFFLLWREKKSRFYLFKTSYLILFFAGLSLIYFAAFNLTSHQKLIFKQIPSAFTSSQNVSSKNTEAELTNFANSLRTSAFEPSKTIENLAAKNEKWELARYESGPGIQKLFKSPFNITFNFSNYGTYVDVGYVLLVFAPLLVLLLIEKIRKKSYDQIFYVNVIFISGFLLWLFLSKEIPWYGITLLAPFFLLILDGLENLGRSHEAIKKLFLGSLAVWLVVSTCLFFSPVETAGSTYKSVFFLDITAQTGAENKRLPSLFLSQASYRNINDSIKNSGKVLTNSCYHAFYIENSTSLVICDTYLRNLNYIYFDRDPQKTLARMKAINIKYLILSKTNSNPLNFSEIDNYAAKEIPDLYHSAGFKVREDLSNTANTVIEIES